MHIIIIIILNRCKKSIVRYLFNNFHNFMSWTTTRPNCALMVSVWRQSAVIRAPVERVIRARRRATPASAASMAAASASPISRVQVQVTVSTDSTASTAAWKLVAAWKRSEPGARPSTNWWGTPPDASSLKSFSWASTARRTSPSGWPASNSSERAIPRQSRRRRATFTTNTYPYFRRRKWVKETPFSLSREFIESIH